MVFVSVGKPAATAATSTPTARRVSAPFHGYGATFRQGILRNMVQNQARWTPADLTRLGLY